MDPISASLIAGFGSQLLGGLFGGGGPDMSAQNGQLERLNKLFDLQWNQYQNANLETTDAGTIANLQKTILKNSGYLLDSQAANRAATGQAGSNSEDTRAKALVANQAATTIADAQANLDTTRQQRYNALLPNASTVAAGNGLATNIDAGVNAGNAANAQLMGSLGSILLGGFGNGGGGAPMAQSQSQANPWNLPTPSAGSDFYGILKPGSGWTAPSFGG